MIKTLLPLRLKTLLYYSAKYSHLHTHIGVIYKVKSQVSTSFCAYIYKIIPSARSAVHSKQRKTAELLSVYASVLYMYIVICFF